MIILVKNPSPPKFRKFAIKPPTNPKIIFIMTLLDLPVAKPDSHPARPPIIYKLYFIYIEIMLLYCKEVYK